METQIGETKGERKSTIVYQFTRITGKTRYILLKRPSYQSPSSFRFRCSFGLCLSSLTFRTTPSYQSPSSLPIWSVSESGLTVEMLGRPWYKSVQRGCGSCRSVKGFKSCPLSRWRLGPIYTELLVMTESWRGSYGCTTFICGFL